MFVIYQHNEIDEAASISSVYQPASRRLPVLLLRCRYVIVSTLQFMGLCRVLEDCGVVLCDTRDNSILIVDTYVTIPVSPRSRYIAVYRCSKKYRETAQVSRVSMIPYGSYHWTTSSLQAYDVQTNVIKSLTVKQQSLGHLLLHCPVPISG